MELTRTFCKKLLNSRRILLIGCLFAGLLTLPACVSQIIARQMVGAPNQSLVGYELDKQFSAFDRGHEALLALPGVQTKSVLLTERNLSISYIDIPAGDYGFHYLTQAVRTPGGKVRQISTHWKWNQPHCPLVRHTKHPRGVMVLLHGWGRHKNSLLSYGLAFAQHGYRAVIPDLRGHGDSSGDWVSFGAEEALDISAFLDKLEVKQFDLMGFSLGASVGLHLASQDHRLNQLVVVAPMHSLAQTIPKFVKRSPPWVGKIVANYESKALSLVDELSGYVYAKTSDTVTPAGRVSQPVLFVYGSIDHMSDAGLNKLLHEQGAPTSRLVSLQDMRHTHVLLHQSALMEPIKQWLGLGVDALSIIAPDSPTPNEDDNHTCGIDEIHL